MDLERRIPGICHRSRPKLSGGEYYMHSKNIGKKYTHSAVRSMKMVRREICRLEIPRIYTCLCADYPSTSIDKFVQVNMSTVPISIMQEVPALYYFILASNQPNGVFALVFMLKTTVRRLRVEILTKWYTCSACFLVIAVNYRMFINVSVLSKIYTRETLYSHCGTWRLALRNETI